MSKEIEPINILKYLDNDYMSDQEKLQLALHEHYVPAPILHEFACRCAEKALAQLNIVEPIFELGIKTKRNWLMGEVLEEERRKIALGISHTIEWQNPSVGADAFKEIVCIDASHCALYTSEYSAYAIAKAKAVAHYYGNTKNPGVHNSVIYATYHDYIQTGVQTEQHWQLEELKTMLQEEQEKEMCVYDAYRKPIGGRDGTEVGNPIVSDRSNNTNTNEGE